MISLTSRARTLLRDQRMNENGVVVSDVCWGVRDVSPLPVRQHKIRVSDVQDVKSTKMANEGMG